MKTLTKKQYEQAIERLSEISEKVDKKKKLNKAEAHEVAKLLKRTDLYEITHPDQ